MTLVTVCNKKPEFAVKNQQEKYFTQMTSMDSKKPT